MPTFPPPWPLGVLIPEAEARVLGVLSTFAKSYLVVIFVIPVVILIPVLDPVRCWSYGSSNLTKNGGPGTPGSSPAWGVGSLGSCVFSPMPCPLHTRCVDPKVAIRTGILLTDMFTHPS